MCVCVKKKVAAVKATKPSSDDDFGDQAWFRGQNIITTKPERFFSMLQLPPDFVFRHVPRMANEDKDSPRNLFLAFTSFF